MAGWGNRSEGKWESAETAGKQVSTWRVGNSRAGNQQSGETRAQGK